MPARILLAGDTRASTGTLAEWVGGAFAAQGGEVAWAGVLPTPAVSHLLRDLGGFGAGVVVSASHNPAEDNGIKLVDAGGVKWPVDEEAALEARLRALDGLHRQRAAAGRGRRHWRPGRSSSSSRRSLPRRWTACSWWSTRRTAPPRALAEPFFTRLGARARGDPRPPRRPQHQRRRAARSIRTPSPPRWCAWAPTPAWRSTATPIAPSWSRPPAGCSTATTSSSSGRAPWPTAGRLPGMVAVATVMSNLGLEVALRRAGITLLRSAVGDREVWEVMQQSGAALGGEQSGHVICSHLSASGDGLLTAAHVMAIAHASGRSLADLADLQPLSPGAPERAGSPPGGRSTSSTRLAPRSGAAEAALDGHGRVFVRYSGTEPLLRIMVEADSEDEARGTADRLAAIARAELGAP